MELKFAVDNYREKDEGVRGELHFTSIGTLDLDDETCDDSVEYDCGEMDMQHGSAVIDDLKSWASENDISEEYRYKFEVVGYKGDLVFLGKEKLDGLRIPINKTSACELIGAFLHTQDLETLKKIAAIVDLKGVKIDGDYFEYPEDKDKVETIRDYLEVYRR